MEMKRIPFSFCCCAILIGVSLLFLVNGCKKKEVKVQERTFNVNAALVETRPLRPFIEAVGTLNPFEEVTVSAEIEGILKAVNVEEGTIVTKGMTLAEIKETDYLNEVKRDEALLRQAEANLSNIKLEFQRKEALFKEGLVTKQQYDDVTTRLSLAEAEIDRVNAMLSMARQKLSKTKVISPMAGVIKEKKVSSGDFVKNGTPLFVLIQTNPLKLIFTVPESDVAKLKVNQDVILKVSAYPDREFHGKSKIIYPSLEEKTRSLSIEAIVPNQDRLLKPGLFAKVILFTGEARQTVVVPVTSLLYEAEKVKVFVIEGDRARERMVKIGSKYGEMMEIKEGLKPGEKIAITGQQNLSEGAKVVIRNEIPKDGKQGG
ncbi:MAG: efflux RND transporter periplasmic adaptor subunit [Syntrophorhabdaceae bacterium]|nr:efflux RND transporter periplasmic adaptor subunit [Syntrophorhabdaceae bacterium]